ncbi:MAG: LysR substrate-binding domain-containing protein [Verrucomicrobiota bacterium]|nr:LysR substrate-binding domain-containing protein [Verrucomicrobiota bacterium]
MELRHLRYFVAVGEALSFTGAAKKLRLAQPSLSRQIRDLEEELGVRLLDRTTQGTRLTPSGKSFLADARRVLAHGEQIVQAVRRLDRDEKRDLRIGYVADLVYDLLPPSIAAFQAVFPTVPVHLYDMTCGEQLTALSEGRLDLGFLGSPEVEERAGIRARQIAAYKTVAAVSKKNPLARRSVIKLKELEPMFFVGISEQSRPGYRKWLTSNCAKAGYRPKVLQEVDFDRPVLHAVASGLGVALLPAPVKKLPHPDVVFRPVSPPIVTPFWVAWREDVGFPAIEAYVSVVTDFNKRMR